MTKEETMDLPEFVNRLWTEYPRDLCHHRPGTKPNLESAAKKIKVTQYKQILLDMDALKRYDRLDKDPDRWPAASRFLNGQYWTRVLESVMNKKESKPDKKCKCGQPVAIRMECINCYSKRTENRQKHKENLSDIGLYSPGMSIAELSKKCKERGSVNGTFSPSHLIAECLQTLSMKQALKSSPQKTLETEDTGSQKSPYPVGSREWFKQNGWTDLDHNHNGLIE